MKGCKTRLIAAKIRCKDCATEYCLRHRFAADHACNAIKPKAIKPKKAAAGWLDRARSWFRTRASSVIFGAATTVGAVSKRKRKIEELTESNKELTKENAEKVVKLRRLESQIQALQDATNVPTEDEEKAVPTEAEEKDASGDESEATHATGATASRDARAAAAIKRSVSAAQKGLTEGGIKRLKAKQTEQNKLAETERKAANAGIRATLTWKMG
jgi:hypothetical protein